MFSRGICFLGVVCAVWLCSSAVTLAQPPTLRTLLVGVDRRSATSLDGPWHYLVDPPPARELYDRDGKIRDSGYAQNTHPNISSGPHNAEYDFATAPTLNVPGDWNTQDPTLFRFEGVVWYERDFSFAPQANSRTFLHIGAANYRSVVWVNGNRICEHEGGFTPFDCEVTAGLRSGNNSVVIAVDSTRHQDDIPSLLYDWFNYGGITRGVSLVSVPAQFIDDYDVHLKHSASFSSNDANTLTGYLHVQDATAGTPVTVEISEAGVKLALKTDASGRADFEVKTSSLQLWSPQTPRLYKVELRAGSDAITDDIGFRDVRVEGTRILLNGSPVFLQGADAHAEAPIRGGRAHTEEDVNNVFSMLHQIDANFVRLAHYPHEERMERMADRQGIMIWSEIPLWQGISFDRPEVYAKAVAVLNEMIRRDRNKASVILWSISNETPRTAERTSFLTNLANEARKLDSTRLITSALIGPRSSAATVVQDDPLTEALDVIGQNEYIGWYEGKPEDADSKIWKFPNKPVIMTEFGAEAKFGDHGPSNQRWTEEQQLNVYQHQFIMLEKIPQLCGVTPWILMDFRSPTRNIPKLQDGYNRKGLFSEKMEKKLAADAVKKAYDEQLLAKPK